MKRLTDKRLGDRSRDRVRKEEHGHDERAHVLRSLGERILEPSDGGENLAERDQNVSMDLYEFYRRQSGATAYDPVWIQTSRDETSGFPCAS